MTDDGIIRPLEDEQLPERIARELRKLAMTTDRAAPRHESGRSWFDRYGGTINVVLGVVLTLTLSAAGVAYRTSTMDIDENTANIAALAASLKSLQEDRSARIAKLDEWRETVEAELRIYRVALSDFRKIEGVVGELGKKLSDGRDERLRDRDTDRSAQQAAVERIMGAVSKLETQVALLRQSVEARGRNPGVPFGESQALPWSGRLPPYGLRASLDATSVGGEPEQ